MRTNWAGNVTYRARRVHEPESIDALRKVVAGARKIRALGARHSFNDLADSDELVSLGRIEPEIAIDAERATVTLGAGVPYGALAEALEAEGWALHNMASLPHVSVAGAVATATHGSGDRSGNLSTAVVGMELVTAEGDLLRVTRDEQDFPGMVVHLGALGVVTRLTLRIEPSYLVRQQVFQDLSWDVALDRFDEIMASDDSVCYFTDFGETVDEVWRKRRVLPDDVIPLDSECMGAPAATKTLHPVPTFDAEGCTEQLGVPGPWLERLPHFRFDAIPATGNEIHAEYMVTRANAVSALAALREIGPTLRPHLWTSEIRTVAGDDLWLSSAYGGGVACFHFSFRLDPEAVGRLTPLIEDVLVPFAPRPHWGKVFVATAGDLAPRYSRMADFHALASRLDPDGKFRNDFLDRHVFE
jgi:alditol oxidase